MTISSVCVAARRPRRATLPEGRPGSIFDCLRVSTSEAPPRVGAIAVTNPDTRNEVQAALDPVLQEFLRVSEAAAKLRLHGRTLDRYRKTGGGPACYMLGTAVVCALADLAGSAAARRYRNSSRSDALLNRAMPCRERNHRDSRRFGVDPGQPGRRQARAFTLPIEPADEGAATGSGMPGGGRTGVRQRLATTSRPMARSAAASTGTRLTRE